MVVDYEKVKPRVDEDTGVIGAVLAGRAHGSLDSDVFLHDFLRNMEPPAHDSWDKYDENMRLYAKGAPSKRSKIIDGYRAALKRLSKINIETRDQSVKALSAMLRFQGQGRKKKSYKIQTSNFRLQKDVSNHEASLSFEIYCNNLIENPNWTAGLKLKIKGISDVLKIESFSPDASHADIVSADIKNNELLLNIVNEDRVYASITFGWPEYIDINEELAIDLLARYVQ